MMLSDGSPCEKTISLRRYATTRFPRPVASRNAFASNAAFFFAGIDRNILSRSGMTRWVFLSGGDPARRRLGRGSVVQDDAQQRAMDRERQVAVIVDEAEPLELVEEEIHAGARRPHDL